MDASTHLRHKGRSLEDQFFAKQNQEQIDKMKSEVEAVKTREALAAATGIHDEAILDDLAHHHVTPQSLAALALSPLVFVAWADGALDNKEREAVLKAAAEAGVKEGSTSFGLLADWLDNAPDEELFETWKEYVGALCQELDGGARQRLKDHVVGNARKVAEASGGFFGLGSKVSAVEEKALAEIEAAFQ